MDEYGALVELLLAEESQRALTTACSNATLSTKVLHELHQDQIRVSAAESQRFCRDHLDDILLTWLERARVHVGGRCLTGIIYVRFLSFGAVFPNFSFLPWRNP